MRTLDIGCGYGRHLAGLAGEVHALDIDDVALSAAKRHAPSATLVLASADRLPYRDAYFDRVQSGVALPYMDIPAVLAEIRRTLVPGGELEFSYHPFGQVFGYWLRSIAGLHFRAAIFNTYALLNGVLFHFTGRVLRFPNGKFESFQTVRGIKLALRRAGLTFVKAEGRRPGYGPRIHAVK